MKGIAGRLLRVVSTFVPKRDLVLFVSLDGYAGNGRVFYEAVVRTGFADEAMWLSLDKDQERSLARWSVPSASMFSLRGIWLLMRARWLVSTHGGLGRFKALRGQHYVNLWHSLPQKNSGYLLSGEDGAQLRETVQRCDVMPSSSPLSRALTASRFHVRADRVFVTGLPRNDSLVDGERSRGRLMEYLGSDDFDRVVLYSPTHRQNLGGPIESTWTFDRFCDEYLVGELVAELKRLRILLLIKLHPFDERRGAADGAVLPPNVGLLTERQLAERGVDLYELLGGFDALWTDYSSIAVDYLLTGRPVFYFVDDADEYSENRGIILGDSDLLVPGPKIRGVASLLEAIRQWFADPGFYQEERDTYSRLVHTAQPPYSENLLDVMKSLRR